MLTYIIPNPIRVSTSGGMSKKVSSFIPKSKEPTSLMGVANAVCQTPLFSTKTLAISSIQATTVFPLATTLCENGGTPKVMVRSEDIFVPLAIPHLVSKANCTEVSKVQPES